MELKVPHFKRLAGSGTADVDVQDTAYPGRPHPQKAECQEVHNNDDYAATDDRPDAVRVEANGYKAYSAGAADEQVEKHEAEEGEHPARQPGLCL